MNKKKRYRVPLSETVEFMNHNLAAIVLLLCQKGIITLDELASARDEMERVKFEIDEELNNEIDLSEGNALRA